MCANLGLLFSPCQECFVRPPRALVMCLWSGEYDMKFNTPRMMKNT